ncbi:MAG: aminotransferase class III-fold pyridoxal phosphate-dependent enzyme [Desulfobacteraceae bacterium]|nr:MAG: aminotransferase class III-fold pyridoxal phosphate-dependent enzyme [Desulfobacteraceae bacterium]
MTQRKHPKSIENSSRVKKYLPGGVHYNTHSPKTPIERVIPFHKGIGSRVWDPDGNEYLDLFCKFGALIVGHQNLRYNEALKDCIDRVLAVDQCHLEHEVCERIVHLIPCAEMVRFGLSGTESIQNALRLARAYSGKQKFIRFIGHYHGNADNIMGGAVKDPRYPAPFPGVGDYDTEGRDPEILQRQSFLIPWNDSRVLEELLSNCSQEIAAVIMEPIAINGGGVLPEPGYLEKARSLCSRYGVVLIFDEVITGFRVGLNGAQGLFGVVPDLAVFGKALAGGAVPVSAIVGKKEIMNLYAQQRVVHMGTFNGYPLGLAAIRATLQLLAEDSGCFERMGSLNLRIAECFVEAAKNASLPLVIQGVPNALLFHVREKPVEDMVNDPPDLERNALLYLYARQYGILFSYISRMYPNLLLAEDDVAFFRERIGEALIAAKKALQLLGRG